MADLDPTPLVPCDPRPPVGIDLKHPRLGLALSGGGYRAAAFHLGALRAINDLGLLDTVSNLSVVSGGAIAGTAWLYHRAKKSKDFGEFFDWFGGFLRSVTIDVPDVLEGALDPFHTDTDYLISSYERHLFGKDTLGLLNRPDSLPRLCINATCLNTGKDWKFYPDVMGDWRFCKDRPGATWKDKFYPAREVPIAVAVAASSCFPPVFAPLILSSKTYFLDQAKTIPYVALTDGGMYDNQGLNALRYAVLHGDPCTHIIASDGSGPFEIEAKPGKGQTVYITRSSSIMMAKLRAFELESAQLQGQATGVPRIAFFSLDSKLPSEPLALLKRCDISTRLKKLSRDEFDALVEHAGNLTTARVKAYLLAQPAAVGAEHVVRAPDGNLRVLPGGDNPRPQA